MDGNFKQTDEASLACQSFLQLEHNMADQALFLSQCITRVTCHDLSLIEKVLDNNFNSFHMEPFSGQMRCVQN